MSKLRKARILKTELDKLTPEIRRLAKTLTHGQIAAKLGVALNTVRDRAKGVVRETPPQEARYATDVEQKGKAKYVRALDAQNKRFLKKGQHKKILSNRQILEKILKRFGTTFSTHTLGKILNDKNFTPVGKEKIVRLAGETVDQAIWRIAKEARAAFAAGTATPKQIKIVEDLARKNAAQALSKRENTILVEGGKGSRDFSFLDNMSDQEIDDLAIRRGNDTYYQYADRSNVYKTDPVTGVKTKIGSSLTANPFEREKIKQWFIDRQRESFKHRNALLEGDHIISRSGMLFKGAPESWISGLGNRLNLQALEYAENAAKSDIFTAEDAAKIERQMMKDIRSGRFKTLFNLGSKVRGIGGLIALPAVGLASMFTSPEKAEAMMKYTSAAVDPLGSALFPYGEGYSKGTPENWQETMGYKQSLIDPNWPGLPKR